MVSMAPKQKRPAGLRGVWSGKRDSNLFLESANNQWVARVQKDIGCKIGETFAAFQGVSGNGHEAPRP